MLALPEIAALVEILNRAPTTQAEKIWLEHVFNREVEEAKEREKKEESKEI